MIVSRGRPVKTDRDSVEPSGRLIQPLGREQAITDHRYAQAAFVRLINQGQQVGISQWLAAGKADQVIAFGPEQGQRAR